MLTRAICLLIIVGDHEALSSNENWDVLIQKCFQKGVMLRNGKKLHPRVQV